MKNLDLTLVCTTSLEKKNCSVYISWKNKTIVFLLCNSSYNRCENKYT